MTKFHIQELTASGAWRPRAIRFTQREADLRCRELVLAEPRKRFKITTNKPTYEY